jgi:endonuclease/exonuclease/phosphatase family metal-dependent hydrolase
MQRTILWLLSLLFSAHLWAASLTVATYNLEIYLDAPAFDMKPKSREARRHIREAIRQMNPDVLALEEVGAPSALAELRDSLKAEGINFPEAEYVRGRDPNLHVAFLSKFPIVSRHPHTNESFLLQGRRFHPARGFGEIEIEVPGGPPVTLVAAHLKSKRQVGETDQEALRIEEASVLREILDEHLKANPKGYLILLGDLNDGIDTRALKTIMGRGRTKLFDTKPCERNGDSPEAAHGRYQRRIAWTHYYAKEELYSRIDYILTSPNLRSYFDPQESYIATLPDWGIASDHRPICARFEFN